MPFSRSRSIESMTRSALVGWCPERAGLPEHRVDERGLAVVDVGDDRDVAQVVRVGSGGHDGIGPARTVAPGRIGPAIVRTSRSTRRRTPTGRPENTSRSAALAARDARARCAHRHVDCSACPTPSARQQTSTVEDREWRSWHARTPAHRRTRREVAGSGRCARTGGGVAPLLTHRRPLLAWIAYATRPRVHAEVVLGGRLPLPDAVLLAVRLDRLRAGGRALRHASCRTGGSCRPRLLIAARSCWAFRLTCYYYRKAYYRAFWLSPPACAVRRAAPQVHRARPASR